MSFPKHHNLATLSSRLNAGPCLGFLGDSFAVGEQGNNRLPDQIVAGIAMSDINGMVAVCQDSANHVLPVKVSANLTGDTPGTNYEDIETGNLYRVNGVNSGTDHWGVPARFGAAVLFDATLTTGAAGLIFSSSLPAAGVANWDHANSVNSMNVVAAIDANGFKFRPIYLPFASGDTYNRTLTMLDGATTRWGGSGTQGASQRMTTTARGKLLNSETPESSNVPDYAHANALRDTIVQNDAFAIHDSSLTSEAPNNGLSTNFVSLLAYRVDAAGDYIGGTIPFVLADSSWAVAGFAADAEATAANHKRFSQTQFAHWLDAKTVDATQPSVYFWSFDPEGGTAASVKADCLAAMAVADGAHDDVGIPRAFHVWIGPHTTGSTTNAINFNQGMYDAAVAHGNAGFFSLYKATDGIHFDNSDAAEDAFLVSKGADNLTFGTVSGVDCTLAAILSDGIHPTENGAAFFMSLLSEAMAEAQAGKPGGTDMSWEDYIENTIGAKHLWRVSEADTAFVDVIGGKNITFSAGITTEQATGLIGNITDKSILGAGTSDAFPGNDLLLPDSDMQGPFCVGCLFKMNGAPASNKRVWHIGDPVGAASGRSHFGLEVTTTQLQAIRDGSVAAPLIGLTDVLASGGTLVDNNWHLILINYDIAAGSPYLSWSIDGSAFADPISGVIWNNQTSTATGWPHMHIMQSYAANRTCHGVGLDELFVVDQTLSGAQAADIYDKALVTGFPQVYPWPLIPGMGGGMGIN